MRQRVHRSFSGTNSRGKGNPSPLSHSRLLERRLDIRFTVEPVGEGQLFRTQKIRIEQFRLIAAATVGKDRDDGLARTQVFGEPDGAGDIDARRAAEAEPFMFEKVKDE